MVGFLWQAAIALNAQAVRTPATTQHGSPAELVVKNPVPGVVGQAFQFAFNLPTWLQVGGAVIAAAIGLFVLMRLYGKRALISAWLGKQSTGYKIGLAAIAGFMLLGAGGVGYAGNHYMQHDNDFCVGCHVMGDAWGAFQRSEHRKLQCHDCHRQSIFVSAKQLFYWVAEKPQEIPKHSKVPTNVCKECHEQSASDSSWKRIVATAGHRLHLNSDSSALKQVECVTCHGQEVHRFVPVDKTCGQSNCHATKDTKITLGKMAGQSAQHCTGCHTFTQPVPEDVSLDSVRQYLVANGSPESCFGCHEMKSRLKGFQAKSDRGHNGVCGTCHNPHQQTEAKQAYESCAASGCHFDLKKKSPFHAGNKGHASGQCGQCHEPHEWKTKGRECIDCHANVFKAPVTARPASYRPTESASDRARGHHPSRVRASNLRVARGRVARGRVARGRVARRGLHGALRPVGFRVTHVAFVRSTSVPQPPRRISPKDSPAFSHQTHRVLACGGCHDQKLSPGALKVRTKSECAACHHSPDRSVTCEGCHNVRTKLSTSLMRLVSMRISAKKPLAQRSLPFAHKQHRDLECKGCHVSGVLLAVTGDCASCHREHHTAESACITCHRPAKTAHVRDAHDGCAGSTCHTNAAVLALPPSRSTCLTCHAEQVSHKPKRECAECHAVSWSTTVSTPR